MDQAAVRDFHVKCDLPVGAYAAPRGLDEDRGKLRHRLLQEELDEYKDALRHGDLIEQCDALGDLLYLVLGGFVEMGVDARGVFWAIHDSNMTKEGDKRDDGKVLKGRGYRAPKIAEEIALQVEEEARLALECPF